MSTDEKLLKEDRISPMECLLFLRCHILSEMLSDDIKIKYDGTYYAVLMSCIEGYCISSQTKPNLPKLTQT